MAPGTAPKSRRHRHAPTQNPTPRSGEQAAADKPGGLVEPLSKRSLINASRHFPNPGSTWHISLNYLSDLNSVYK